MKVLTQVKKQQFLNFALAFGSSCAMNSDGKLSNTLLALPGSQSHLSVDGIQWRSLSVH